MGAAVRLEGDRLEEKLDVESVIEGLPENLRQLAQHLRSKTPWEIAKETGIPRTNLYRAIEKLRKRFREAGLEEIPCPSGRFGENAGK
jgi:DNA-directed RNA polymerase specialized sigma24 family protein